MFAHQLAVGALDGGGIVRWLHAQHVAGVFQGWTALRLLPAAACLLLITAAELRAALHHAQKLIELDTRDPQFFGDNIQHLTFIRVQRTIGEGGLNLNFQEHSD